MIFSLHDTLFLNIAYSHYRDQTYKKYRHINRTLAIVKDPEQLFDKKAFWRRNSYRNRNTYRHDKRKAEKNLFFLSAFPFFVFFGFGVSRSYQCNIALITVNSAPGRASFFTMEPYL